MNIPKISAMQTQATSEAVKIIPYEDFKGLEDCSLATYNLMLHKADAGYTFKFSKATPNEAENQKIRKAVQDSLLVGPMNGNKEFAYLQTVAKESSNATRRRKSPSLTPSSCRRDIGTNVVIVD